MKRPILVSLNTVVSAFGAIFTLGTLRRPHRHPHEDEERQLWLVALQLNVVGASLIGGVATSLVAATGRRRLPTWLVLVVDRIGVAAVGGALTMTTVTLPHFEVEHAWVLVLLVGTSLGCHVLLFPPPPPP